MKNSMKIKICGMKDSQNIIEINTLQPDYMGFIHYDQSPRFVGKSFSDYKNTTALTVAVVVNMPLETLLTLGNEYDYLQLHGNESAELCSHLHQAGIKLIKAVGINEQFNFTTLAPYLPFVAFFIFDTHSKQYGGTGVKFDWSLLTQYTYETPFMLSGGISLDSISEIKTFTHPQLMGLDLNSRFEIEPGVKDTKKLTEFLSLLFK